MRVLAAERRDVVRARRVDPGGDEPRVVREPRDGPLGAAEVVVGDDHPLEEVAPDRDRHDRAADTTGADDEDPHPMASAVTSWRGRSLADPSAVVAALRGPRAISREASFQSMEPGEAVAELGAGAVGQVPGPTRHVRPAIDDRHGQRSTPL